MMRRGGFTLIELLIVIMIIAVLAGAMIPMFRTTRLNAQQARANADLDSIKTASIMYHFDSGQWPPIGNVGNGYINNVPVAPNWNGPYLDEWKNDPWLHPYVIFNGTGVNRFIESWGPNGSNETTGDDLGLLMTPNTAF